jgi:hypothetical protein
MAAPPPFAPITVNRYLIQKDQDRQMVKNPIVRHRTDGALVRVSSPVYGGVQDTSDRLARDIQAMDPLLGDYLPE